MMEALKELLYKIADDQLIIGHRNSEWTGLGPMLEEDIAFSSMAQDKVGQSQALYQMLHALGENEPDTIAFNRHEGLFHCCHLVEYPIGEYDFSLVRHFLFDNAEQQRFDMLANSSYEPLAKVSRKFKGEIKYHVFHGNTWMIQLGLGTEESRIRMQSALDFAFPLALGIFEPSPFEAEIISKGWFAGEAECKQRWLEAIAPVIEKAELKVPDVNQAPAYGGRQGKHTQYLAPLIEEMSEVFREDPTAEW